MRQPRSRGAAPRAAVLIEQRPGTSSASLRNLLTERGIDVVGLAHDGHEALTRTRTLRPDLVLMGVTMPRLDGVQATRALKATFPEVTVFMLTQTTDDDLFAARRPSRRRWRDGSCASSRASTPASPTAPPTSCSPVDSARCCDASPTVC